MDLLVSEKNRPQLKSAALGSIIYHDIFDYPLTLSELIKWELGKDAGTPAKETSVRFNKGYYFLAGKEGLVLKRLMRNRISARKLLIAERAARILKIIPSIKMIGITGALAMENADEDADIDLLIVTKKNVLWTTRLISLVLLKVIGFPTRKFGDTNQKDKLCLNMWLDESLLVWPKGDRNVYTAHEISQIRPLYDKEATYIQLLFKNEWIKRFWPNATKILKPEESIDESGTILSLFEPLARSLQFWYMKPKITREVIGKRRALFHPNNWWSFISARLPLDSRESL